VCLEAPGTIPTMGMRKSAAKLAASQRSKSLQVVIAGRQAPSQHLVRRCADHATKRPRKMRGVGEPGCVGGGANRPAGRHLAGAALKAEPQDVGAERDADGTEQARCRRSVQLCNRCGGGPRLDIGTDSDAMNPEARGLLVADASGGANRETG
jgi:hypothetical protein